MSNLARDLQWFTVFTRRRRNWQAIRSFDIWATCRNCALPARSFATKLVPAVTCRFPVAQPAVLQCYCVSMESKLSLKTQLQRGSKLQEMDLPSGCIRLNGQLLPAVLEEAALSHLDCLDLVNLARSSHGSKRTVLKYAGRDRKSVV